MMNSRECRYIRTLSTLLLVTMSACLDGTPGAATPEGTADEPATATSSLVAISRSYLPIVEGIDAHLGFYATGIRIQNPGTRTATVRVLLYSGGATPVAVLRGPITSGASVTLFPLHVLPAGWVTESSASGVSLRTFEGAAVVEADQPVATAVNLNRNCGAQPCAMGSYDAVEASTGYLVAPLLQKDTAGATSWLAIQNADTEATTASIEFRPRGVGSPATVNTVSLPPGATVQVRLDDVLPIGATFIGSAIVQSPPDINGARSPLAVVANLERHDAAANLHTLQSYTALDPGLATTQVALPLVMANNAGWLTGIVITNAGFASASIRVDYSANQVVGTAMACAPPPSRTFTGVTAGSTVSYATGGSEPGFAGCRYVGAARVTSTGAPVVALVTQVTPGASSASIYEGTNVVSARDTLSLPIIMANNGGSYTGVQIQNVSAKATQVTLLYQPNVFAGDNQCPQPPAVTQTLAPGASKNFLQAGAGFFATCRYVGSAVVTGQNTDGSLGQLAVVVNEARLTPDPHQDSLMSYTGRLNP